MKPIFTTALPCFPKILHPSGIRTRIFLFIKKMRWPLHHASSAVVRGYVRIYLHTTSLEWGKCFFFIQMTDFFRPCCASGELTGWPDEFVKKITQNTAQPTLSSTLMHNFYSGESSRKISAIFKNVFKSKPSPNRRKSAESGHPGGGLLSSCYQPPQASLVLPPFDIFISNFRLPRAASTDIYGWQYQSNPSPPQPIHMCLCRNIAPGKIMDFQSQPFFSNVDS
jgi:hypothetical protein